MPEHENNEANNCSQATEAHQEKEIERLRGELHAMGDNRDDYQSKCFNLSDRVREQAERITALEAMNERLKALSEAESAQEQKAVESVVTTVLGLTDAEIERRREPDPLPNKET